MEATQKVWVPVQPEEKIDFWSSYFDGPTARYKVGIGLNSRSRYAWIEPYDSAEPPHYRVEIDKPTSPLAA